MRLMVHQLLDPKINGKTRHETGGSDASVQFEPTGEPKEVNSQSNTADAVYLCLN